MRVGVHLPQLGRSASLQHLIDVATRAEELGFADVWTADHIAVPVDLEGMPSFFPEPVPILSAVAAHTNRIGLGTSVIIPAYRNPMQFAKQWATLDWLAPGRTILGVGAGWLQEEFDAVAVTMRNRGQRLDDYIRGWRVAWSGGSSYDSGHWRFEGVRVNPTPAQPIPIWVGGSSAGALRRAAWCDGWQGTWAPVDVFAERLARLRNEIDSIGRDRCDVTISIHCEFRLGKADAAGRWSEVGDGYGDRAMLTGTPSDIAEVLSSYMGAGLNHLLLVPVAATTSEWQEHITAANEIRIALRD